MRSSDYSSNFRFYLRLRAVNLADSAIMETPDIDEGDRLRKQKQREARRRKILANAGTRMERLKNMNRGTK